MLTRAPQKSNQQDPNSPYCNFTSSPVLTVTRAGAEAPSLLLHTAGMLAQALDCLKGAVWPLGSSKPVDPMAVLRWHAVVSGTARREVFFQTYSKCLCITGEVNLQLGHLRLDYQRLAACHS